VSPFFIAYLLKGEARCILYFLKSRFSIGFCYIEFRLILQGSSHRYRLYSLKCLFLGPIGYIDLLLSARVLRGSRSLHRVVQLQVHWRDA